MTFLYINSTILLLTQDTVLQCSILKLIDIILIFKFLTISSKVIYCFSENEKNYK
jgi:hypothetical protein